MANILYLVHRLPYPPDKGDKVRSYHLLKHLAERHRVFVGTFVDDPDDEAARELAANDFKYWELMRRSCERGLKVFDYGRSKQGTGSYSFKKNWGFEPTPLHYEYRLYKRDSVPQNNPANAKYRLLIQAWRRLPVSFANWLGPYLVRSLG